MSLLAVWAHLALLAAGAAASMRNSALMYTSMSGIGGVKDRGAWLGRHPEELGTLNPLWGSKGREIGHAYSTCDDETSAFHVNNIELQPDRIARGSTATFRIGAVLREGRELDDVESGRVSMLVQYGGIRVFQEEDGICDLVEACPLPRDGGEFQILYVKHFPSITPPGKYEVELRGEVGDATLFCVRVKFQVAFW